MKIPFVLLRVTIGIALVAVPLQSQSTETIPARRIVFPDIPGYETLKCDLHMHTVFSDGSVWPDIRIQEALLDGLDAISLTEHLEYQPHADDIPHPDRNRAHAVGLEILERLMGSDKKDPGLILIQGSEITRRMPPGHANAIFLEDSNKILLEDRDADPTPVFREAKRQGAFVFWNHPTWVGQQPNGVATVSALHRRLIDEGLIDGIEVANDLTYSDEALRIALDEGLTILGTSDIHGLVDWRFHVHEGGHRPLTLVLASDKSEAAIKEALFAGRTVAWYEKLLAGKGEYLVPLIEASLQADGANYAEDKQVLNFWLENQSSATYVLRNTGRFGLYNSGDVLTVEPKSRKRIQIKTLEQLDRVELPFEVLNALTAPGTYARIELSIRGITVGGDEED